MRTDNEIGGMWRSMVSCVRSVCASMDLPCMGEQEERVNSPHNCLPRSSTHFSTAIRSAGRYDWRALITFSMYLKWLKLKASAGLVNINCYKAQKPNIINFIQLPIFSGPKRGEQKSKHNEIFSLGLPSQCPVLNTGTVDTRDYRVPYAQSASQSVFRAWRPPSGGY